MSAPVHGANRMAELHANETAACHFSGRLMFALLAGCKCLIVRAALAGVIPYATASWLIRALRLVTA